VKPLTETRLHPSDGDVVAYAQTEAPEQGRYSPVRDHLRDGCVRCEARFERALIDGLGPTGDSAQAPSTGDWLEPRQVSQSLGSGGGARTGRAFLCTAGVYEVDVIVYEYQESDRVQFAGQVTWADRTHEPVPRLGLALIDAADGEAVSHAETDALGEFVVTAPRKGKYGLRVGRGARPPHILVWQGAGHRER